MEVQFGTVHHILKRKKNTDVYILLKQETPLQRINRNFFATHIYQTRRSRHTDRDKYTTLRKCIENMWMRFLIDGIVP